MRQGITYSISFYVRPYQSSSYISSSIAVHFSKEPLVVRVGKRDSDLFSIQPSVAGSLNTYYEENKWTHIEMQYTATGGEQYFSLANFLSNEKTNLKRIKKSSNDDIVFLIDDIRVYAPSDTFNCCNRCLIYSHYFDQHFSTGKVYNLPGVHFSFRDTLLADGCYPDLEAIKQLLDYFPNWKARLIGNTDSVGDISMNQLLSEGRAHAVKKLLQIQGIAPERLLAEGRGASHL